MTVRTAVLLLSLVAIALSQPPPVKFGGNITLHEPLLAHFGPWNLESEVTITIEHTVPVQVCVVLQQFGSPNETQYSTDVCTSYQNFTVPANHQSTFTFPALAFNYTVGVYFANPMEITKENLTHVGVDVTGAVCGMGSYYSAQEKKCKEAIVFKGNETLTETFAGQETTFFTWEAPERVPVLTFKLTDEAENGQPEDYVIKARYAGNPEWAGGVAADTNGTVTVNLPLPGVWVFAVYRSVATPGTARVSVTGEACTERGTAGPGCNKIPAAENNVTLTVTAETGHTPTYHFWINASKTTPVWVSVTTFNQSFIPKLFVSKGQLPATDGSNAQITNCNRDYCTTVHSIFYNSTEFPEAGEDWFVTFGVWFNDNCVTGCQTNNRGQCLPDGTCQCYLDFTGIDCAISEGLGAPYIVLIIIASLVVASAVVGFVAWAYMRRKRNDYETLS